MKIRILFVLMMNLTAAEGADWGDPQSFLAHKEYFWGGQHAAGQIKIWKKGALVRLNQMSFYEILRTRSNLEEILETGASEVAGGEVAVRKMLRAIRYRLGPNLTQSDTVVWDMNAVIISKVDVVWKDAGEKKHFFKAQIRNESEWIKCVEREMGYLGDLIYLLSWGKIQLRGRVTVSKVAMTKLSKFGQTYFIDPANAKVAIESEFPQMDSRGWMVWMPQDGEGEAPPWVGTAYTASDKNFMGGAILTAVHTLAERLKKDHGWAKPDGGGLVHEFWHHVEQWLTIKVGFQGFVPDNHQAQHADMMLKEISDEHLPKPFLYYADYFGSLPTGRMLKAHE